MSIKKSQVACKAETKTGKPCKVKAGPSGYCTFHDPARAQAMRDAKAKGGRSVRGITLDGDIPITTPAQVIELLAKLLAEVMNTSTLGKQVFSKARAAATVARVLLTAFELSEVEARLTKLEARLDGDIHGAGNRAAPLQS